MSERSEGVLVVAPHADDEVLGCGGSIARAVADGISVSVLVVTRGDPSIFSTAETDVIRDEMHAAHRRLGVMRTVCLDLPAPRLDTLAEHEVIDRIGSVIGEVRPRTVVTPHAGDPHVDHNVVSRAVLVATRPHPGQVVATVLEYETASETEWSSPDGSHWFVPDVYIDIGDHLDAKLDAMRCYASQLRESPHPRSIEYLRHLAGVRGGTVGVAAAEAFRLVRTIDGAWFGGRP